MRGTLYARENQVTREELGQRLRREGFREGAFSLCANIPRVEGYGVRLDDRKWLVEYYERGNAETLHEFATEGEACEFVYGCLAGDPTEKRRT